MMKLIQSKTYGPPESVLHLAEQPIPTPMPNEVLIKVKATTVNDYDWSMVRGKPYLYRLMYGLFKPKNPIAGMELSGIVEAVGEQVSKFNKGDQVFGDISDYGFGTFAEYMCIDAKAVIKKPNAMGFIEAAALPHAATLALQGLRDLGQLKAGQKVLINGGGGGVGTLAVQWAKLQNCELTGVDSKEKHALMKSMGYDHVVDYKQTDFTKMQERFDLILDCKTGKPAFTYLRVLKDHGRYITIGGSIIKLIGVLLLGKIVPMFSDKCLKILSLKPNLGLNEMAELLIAKKIQCVIDGPYLLEETPKLIQYFGEGRHKGKIVIQIP